MREKEKMIREKYCPSLAPFVTLQGPPHWMFLSSARAFSGGFLLLNLFFKLALRSPRPTGWPGSQLQPSANSQREQGIMERRRETDKKGRKKREKGRKGK